jgi:hypothetical protein
MFTAEDAARHSGHDPDELDRRIKAAVSDGGDRKAWLRVYAEDPWCRSIEWELEKRGFKNVYNPRGMIKWDVSFEWD